jgi:hypothetical protein
VSPSRSAFDQFKPEMSRFTAAGISRGGALNSGADNTVRALMQRDPPLRAGLPLAGAA